MAQTKTFTWQEEFRIFEKGDKVKPLDSGQIYTVTDCHEPCYPGDAVIVFVEGYRYGILGEYLTLVSEDSSK